MSIIRLPCTDITHEADNQSKHHRDSSVIVSNERPLLEINVMYSFLNQVVLENTQVQRHRLILGIIYTIIVHVHAISYSRAAVCQHFRRV